MRASTLVLTVLVVCTADLTSAAVPECPIVDPREDSVFYRDPTDCGKYYECSNGVAIEMNCPAGLHFHTVFNVCDWPQYANCRIGCEPLSDGTTGIWSPSSCSSDVNEIGATCSVQCEDNFTLKGSAFTECTEDGWKSSDGDYIPNCVPVECVVQFIDEVLNETLSVPASLLFVLDESGSVGLDYFIISKEFIKNVISKYQLSATRSAGVITFSSGSTLHIPLQLDSTSEFMKQVDAIPYGGGGTNILGALETAYAEIQAHAVHPLTLVFLVTDGISDTDGTPAADKIKTANQPLFAIGIGSTRIVQLEEISSEGPDHLKNFFHIKDYTVLKTIGEYLNPTLNYTVTTTVTKCT